MTAPCFFPTLVLTAHPMTTVIERKPSQSPQLWAKGLVTGILFTVVALSLVVWGVTGTGLLHLLRSYAQGSVIQIDQPTVVRQIQQLQRLETVQFSMDKIISGEHENPYLPKFLVGDRLLLVVHGEVIAGVDLSQFQAQDVSLRGRAISLHLPKSKILITRIDNSKTRVYSRDTGLFSSPDPNLESQVRQEAERELQEAALQDNILKIADDNARTTLSALLRSLGFTDVEFV